MDNAIYFDKIIKGLHGLPGIVAVLLFGSHAKGAATPESDIDLAILFNHANIPNSLQLWELRQKLSNILGSEVDLICLNQADPIIASQIYHAYVPILINNPEILHQYFARLCIDYAELKELIRPMEGRILERKYYGHE